MDLSIELCVMQTVLISLLDLLMEEGQPGVLGGDEREVLEPEGAGVEQGQVVAAGGVRQAVADADRGVQGRDRGAEVEAAVDLEAAGEALRAGQVAALVEAQAGAARRGLTLEQVGVDEALVQ